MAPPVEENTQTQNDDAAASKTPPHTKQANAEESDVAADDEKPTTEDGNSKQAENEETARESDASQADTPHDESDFEDNITVTVPKPQTHNSNNYHDYRDRQNMNGRYNRSTNVSDVETTSNQQQSHQVGY